MRYKAVIFDLDGTLLNTLEDLAFSVNAVLKRFGFPEHEIEAYRYFAGDGIDMLVKRAFPPEKGEKNNFAGLVKMVNEEYARRWPEHTKPYPGIPPLLGFLEERQIPVAIFSNKPHRFARQTVETLLPEYKFFTVQGLEEGIPRKPDPTGALKIVEQMHLKPEEIVYVGDTNTDMRTAAAGGFYAVGVLWGFRSAAELQKEGAQLLIRKPLQLRDLFRDNDPAGI
ncbi:MAG: HAD family hydrolase [Bacillota bacterium]|nr:HAD family hydrolase [Bacillota bacterium]